MNAKGKWLALLMVVLLIGLTGCKSKNPEPSRTAVEGLDHLETIEVISREEGSGTRSTFAALADFEQNQEGQGQSDLTREDARIANNAEEVIEAVKANPSAIGYWSYVKI